MKYMFSIFSLLNHFIYTTFGIYVHLVMSYGPIAFRPIVFSMETGTQVLKSCVPNTYALNLFKDLTIPCFKVNNMGIAMF